MSMLELKIVDTAVNCVTFQVELQKHRGARIYRARRKAGPYEEVAVAYEETYVDSADIQPGATYYYKAFPWNGPYLCPSLDELRGGPVVPAKAPKAPKEKRVLLTHRRQAFTVRMGGHLDESNTVTKGPEVYCPGPNSSMPPYEQVFEPNRYVAIENVGKTDVVNPWLVANGQRDWWSVETMTREIADLAGGEPQTDREKMMAIWKFMVDEVYDSRAGMSWFDGMSDPVKLANVYGFEGCVGNAVASRRLAEAMGIKAREIWLGGSIDGYGRGASCAHDIFEAFADGAWHFLDTDLMVFFLKRDNRTVAGSEDLARDIDLLRRSHRNLGLCGRDLAEKVFYYSQFANGEFVYPPNKGGVWTNRAGTVTHAPGRYPPPHTMALRLRPGEKLVRYWDQVGKCVIRARRLHPDVRYSNGKLVYRPDLRDSLCLKGTESMRNAAWEKSAKPLLHPEHTGQSSEVVWKVESPYAIAGASVGLTCRRETQEDGLHVLFSKDGQNWRPVWLAPEGRRDVSIDLDWFLNPALNDWREERDNAWRVGPCYSYFIKMAMWAGSRPGAVGLDAVRFDTDIQCSTRSLPSLFCGENTIVYRDENRGPREVQVTYGWQEEHSIRPPGAPELVFPKNGADVGKLDFEFRWRRPKGNGAKLDDYHVQVSRYPDFRWCVCPTFDRYVGRTAYAGKTRWRAQFPNLLNPDEVYYWRVRARNSKGVWGGWSAVRSFVPHGPTHPIDLAIRGRGKRRQLIWAPSAEGNRPVEYRVHGAEEACGFSATEENLLGATAECCWMLPQGSRKMKRYCRVVAVDENGVPSTPSDYTEG